MTDICLLEIEFLVSNICSALISLPLVHLVLCQLYIYFTVFFSQLPNYLKFQQTSETSNSKKFELISILIFYQFAFACFLIMVYVISFFISLENETFKLVYSIIVLCSTIISLFYPLYRVFHIFKLLWDYLVQKVKTNPGKSVLNQQILANDSQLNATNSAENTDNNKVLNYDEYYKEIIDEFFKFLGDLSWRKKQNSKVQIKAVLFITLYIIVLVISILFDFLGNYRWNGKMLYAGFSILLMILFTAFTFPYIMGLFHNFSILSNAEYREIRIIWIIVLAVYALWLVILILFRCLYKEPNKIEYVYHPSFRNTTYGEPALICRTNYYGLDLIQYAGIASLDYAKNLTYANEILKLLFSNSTEFSPPYGNSTPILYPYSDHHSFRVEINSTLSIVSIHSFTDLLDYTFVYENLLMDFVVQKIMGIVPLFDTLFSIVYIEIINVLTNLLPPFYNAYRASTKFAEIIHNLHTNFSYLNSTKVYTGYSTGGMLAKSLSIVYDDSPAIAFNSLQSYYSTFSHVLKTHLENLIQKKIPIREIFFQYFIHKKSQKILNVYSPDSILNQRELGPTINYQTPKVKIRTPCEMLCLISAGCDTTGKYEDFCAFILGSEKKYGQFFDSWNRSRKINKTIQKKENKS